MSASSGARAIGFDELATLKLLAIEGGHRGEVKVSCAALADRLDASNQTASRRLQALEDAGFLERDLVSDGQWVEVTAAGLRELEREYQDYRRIFEERGDLTLSGTVTGGMGEGRHYISLPGYNRQFRTKLGYDPYPGTLNVSLDAASQRARSALDAFDPVEIDGWEDEERTYGPAVCYPATVEKRTGSENPQTDGDRTGATESGNGQTYARAHVIVPVRTHHDEDQLELIAPDRLRDELGLLDDDPVLVHVTDRGDT